MNLHEKGGQVEGLDFIDMSQKEEQCLNFFWIGFAAYSITSSFVTESHYLILLFQLIQIASIALMLYGAIPIIKYRFDNRYVSVIFTIYLAWLLYIFLGVYKFFNYTFFKSYFLGAPSGPMLYFAPIILLFPRNLSYYKKVFNVIIVFGLFYVFYDFIFIRSLISSDSSDKRNTYIIEIISNLAIPCGYIVLTLFYHSRKKQIIAIGVILLGLFFAVLRARRGLILMFGEVLFFGYIIYFFHSKKRLIIVYLTSIALLAGVTYYFHLYRPNENRIIGFLLERGEEDTRTGVEVYFYDDMKTQDWIFGRGVRGEYFCPDIEENQLTNYRDTIETGYLQTILNGGLISLCLFLLIAVPALFNGIFFSRNILAKAAGIWVLMSIINSYPADVNKFTLNYLIVWISIGICYSKEIRQLPEVKIADFFRSRIELK